MRHKSLLFMIISLLYAQQAFASETIVSSIPQASVVGRGTLSYALWDVYEATLYAPNGQFDPEKPFVLSITYHRPFEGKDIANRSVQEMRHQGFRDEIKLATWNAQLKSIFPDVEEGTVLSAIYDPGKQTSFYNGRQLIGSVKGDEFGKLFFDIWLGERTSEPQLRRALLGLL